MKKYIISALLLGACFSLVSAQLNGDVPLPSVGASCVDLQNNLAYKQSKDSNSNGEVSDLQSFLQEQGLLNSDPTGYFGGLTFKAVKEFQKQNNLLAYGYVGQMTRALIKDISCNGVSPVEIPSTDPSNGVQVKFLPGCYSLSGYSITTGQACSGGERKACTQEMRLCPDGSSMKRDANCGWHEEQCSSSPNTPGSIIYSPNGGESFNIDNQPIKISFKPVYGQKYYFNLVDVNGATLGLSGADNGYYTIGMAMDKQTVDFYASTAWVNSHGSQYKLQACTDNVCDLSNNYFSVISGVGTTDAPTALVISGPSLKLSYSNNKEAELIAKATVKVTAGNTDLNVVKPTAQTWPSSTLYFALSALDSNNSGYGGVTISGLVVSSQNAYDKGDYWMIPAGTSAVFNLSQSFNPKQMFAGSYHAVPYAYMTVNGFSGSNIASSKDGNYVTIIGETSPYINSVDCTSKVGACFINGSHFHQNSNNVTINGIKKVLLSEGLNYSSNGSVVGTSIFFNPSDFNLVSGSSYIVQVSTNKGASNNFSFNFTGGVSQNPAATVTVNGIPSLTLGYDSSNKETSLTASYNFSVTAPRESGFKLYKYEAFDDDTYALLINLNNARGANGSSVNGNYDKISGNATDYGNYWLISAGETATFNLTGNLSNPKNLFAGNYNATLSLYKTAGGVDSRKPTVTGKATTNSVVIIGETSSNTFSAFSIARTAGFTAQTVSPNTANVKIGSFVIKNNSNGSEHLSNIGVNLSLSGYSVTNLSNLRLMVDSQMTLSTPIGNPVQGVNNFPVSWGIGAYASPIVDIYADIGGASQGSVVATMSADGVTSTEGVAISSSVSGLANPTLSQNSPADQFVIGGSTFGIATYRLATTQAGTNAIVRELRFVAGGQDAIESITVNGVTSASVSQGVTIISGLNIPVSSYGTDIPVTVKFSGFQYSTSGGSLNSGVSNVGLKLNYIEATSGSGQVITNTTPVSSNGMTLVASRPTVTLGSVVGASPLILGIESKVGEFKVTADNNGKISLSSIGLNLSSSGITNVSYETFRVLSGNTPIVINENGPAGSAKIINFYSPYEIGAGQSVTFSVYARVNGMAQAGVSPTVYSSLLPSAFTWKDVIGGNMQYTGDNLINFPMNSYTVRGDGNVSSTPTLLITDISGLQPSYQPGQPISFTLTGNIPVDSVNGFNVQSYITATGASSNIAGVNGSYNANSGQWAVTLLAPANLGTYNLSVTLYCAGGSCSAQYPNASVGQVTKNFSFSVSPNAPPSVSGTAPTVTLTANPSTITIGQSTSLAWSSTNATYCIASGGSPSTDGVGWVGTGHVNQTVVQKPSVSTTYVITCTGVGGSTTKSVSVNVGSLATTCPLTARVTSSNFAENNTTWGFDVLVNATNGRTGDGWITNFQGYTPSITSYGVIKHYGNFFVSSGPLAFTVQDSVDSNCSTAVTAIPPVSPATPNNTGTYLFPSDCPTACGQAQSTQTSVCTGGNGSCSGVGTSRICNATASCVVTPTCSDPTAYYYYYAPDVKTAGADALNHWNTYGYKEGRKSCWQAPSVITPGVSNNKPTGVIDTVSSGPVGSCGNVAGWAYDPDNYSASTEINLYVDGPAGSGVGYNAGVTTGARNDLNQYFNISGTHGYNYQIPNLTPGNHTVYSYSHGVDTSGKQIGNEAVLLVNSPMSFNCTNSVSFLTPSSKKPVVLGDYISNASCTNLPYNMHRGYEDNNVKKLQSFLVSKGLLTDTPSSFYGDKTVEAVKAYQSSKGLPVTGMVYDFTRKMIKEDTCK